jgi:hypothetical protein
MTTPFRDDYAFGLGVQNIAGCRVIAHLGNIEGFDAELTYFPDSKVTIVTLSNVNGRVVDQLARTLGRLTACSVGP